jgi:hypothetical protein
LDKWETERSASETTNDAVDANSKRFKQSWKVCGRICLRFGSLISILSAVRLIHNIIKNPCDLRFALLSHNFKLSDDFAPPTADNDDDVNRFKREILN